MNYNLLLEMVTDLGYRLAMSGAETYRVEESINRIMAAYGVKAEAYVVPNTIIVSIETDDGQPITRMRRIGEHDNNMDAIECYSNLSRRICQDKPSISTANQWIAQAEANTKNYPAWACMIACFLGAAGFAVLFGAGVTDTICAGICGFILKAVSLFSAKIKLNSFFQTIAASFIMALPAYILCVLGFSSNPDSAVIGALMYLVPGILFTNAVRDIIHGDTNSGINRFVQVFLIAVALALGTGAAWSSINSISELPSGIAVEIAPLWIECIATFIACYSFTFQLNIHGRGSILCPIGSVLAWATYRLLTGAGVSVLTAYFFGGVLTSVYAEIMARIRKYPATSYLVTSLLPLIPGAAVYYTMNFAVKGNLAEFTAYGTKSLAIAGVLAAGVLLATTVVRTCFMHFTRTKQSKKPD